LFYSVQHFLPRQRFAVTIARLPLILAGLVSFALAAMAFRYTANWPRAEDLQFIDMFKRAQQGFLPWLALANSYNVDHPVGIQMLIVTALWQITGVNFLIIAVSNYVLLAASALLLLRAASRRSIAAALLLPLVAFHPTQMNHLIWPYEMGWFIITFILVLNTVAIERFRFPVTWVTIGCAVASYASAHGRLLWLVAALHLIAAERSRSRALIAAAFVVVLLMFAVTSHHGDIPDASTLIRYILSLPGALFGIRDEHWLLLGSAVLLAPLCYLLVNLRRNTPAYRISVALIGASALFLIAFALGRAIHGLPWALDRIHFAPLLVPAAMGIVILATAAIDDGKRWAGTIACAIIALTAVTALPYARQRILRHLFLIHEASSRFCSGDRSEPLTFYFEVGPDINIIRRNAESLMPLCR
jgi:hypothetical protein